MKTIQNGFILVAICLMIGCEYLTEALHPDPHPDWVEVEYPVDTTVIDTNIVDSIVVELDTVCTTYDPILSPQFVTCYMEGIEPSLSFYVLHMFPFSDTINPGDDIEHKLDSLSGLFNTYYNLNLVYDIYSRDGDDRVYCIMITGTSDRNKFAGKLYLRYGNTRHHFGFINEYYHSPSYSCDEYGVIAVKYPSVRYLNFRDSPCDSVDLITVAYLIVDTINCKGGRDWADFRFNEFEMIEDVITKFEVAGWNDVLNSITEHPDVRAITLTSRANLQWYFDNGFMVKEIL